MHIKGYSGEILSNSFFHRTGNATEASMTDSGWRARWDRYLPTHVNSLEKLFSKMVRKPFLICIFNPD